MSPKNLSLLYLNRKISNHTNFLITLFLITITLFACKDFFCQSKRANTEKLFLDYLKEEMDDKQFILSNNLFIIVPSAECPTCIKKFSQTLNKLDITQQIVVVTSNKQFFNLLNNNGNVIIHYDAHAKIDRIPFHFEGAGIVKLNENTIQYQKSIDTKNITTIIDTIKHYQTTNVK